MSKSQQKRVNTIGKKNTCKSNPYKADPIKIYKVGVYFPERDPIDFVIKANDFKYEGNTVYFFTITETGLKEFVASFTYVAYVILTEEKLVIASAFYDLPKEFGNLV